MEMKRDESMNTTLDQNSKFVPRLLNPGFMQEKYISIINYVTRRT